MKRLLGILIAVIYLAPSVAFSDEVQLLKGEPQISGKVERHVVTFELNTMPSKPELHLGFIATSKGTCPITYEPTKVFINSKLIKSLDFRRYSLAKAQDVTVKVPPNHLNVGSNELLIVTGECQYSLDTMKLKKLVLREG